MKRFLLFAAVSLVSISAAMAQDLVVNNQTCSTLQFNIYTDNGGACAGPIKSVNYGIAPGTTNFSMLSGGTYTALNYINGIPPCGSKWFYVVFSDGVNPVWEHAPCTGVGASGPKSNALCVGTNYSLSVTWGTNPLVVTVY